MILQVQVHRCVPGDDGGAAQLYKLWQRCSGATRPLGAPRHPGRKKMIRCRPRRRSQPGHVTVPPLGEWKALRRGQTNHRCPNHEEAGPLEGKDGLLLSGQVGSTPRPGGWREQRRRKRKRRRKRRSGRPISKIQTPSHSETKWAPGKVLFLSRTEGTIETVFKHQKTILGSAASSSSLNQPP